MGNSPGLYCLMLQKEGKIMREELLQFIWRFQYFNHHELLTEAGETLQVLFPGEINTDQGPDFLQARLQIGERSWFGHIELHRVTSDWERHAHQEDKNFRNVILHVVWEDDRPRKTGAGGGGMGGVAAGAIDAGVGGDAGLSAAEIPLLVLQPRVPNLLLGRYEAWMNSRSFIACERQVSQVTRDSWSDWQGRLLEERLQRRMVFIREWLAQNRQHWEETAWWLMARNFGFPVNALAFESIARSIPVALLARHREQPVQMEALLLGQAGLLSAGFTEAYPLMLQKEFRYLQVKFRLQPIHSPVLYLRMRPGNFPTIRLAQLAALRAHCTAWFTHLKEAGDPGELKKLMEVATGPYWDTHYIWEKASPFRAKKLGTSIKDGLIINTFVPLLYTYGCLRGEKVYRDRAIEWLQGMGAEKNAQLTRWGRLGVVPENAAGSQALLELKRRWCEPKKCLDCAIGKKLLGL